MGERCTKGAVLTFLTEHRAAVAADDDQAVLLRVRVLHDRHGRVVDVHDFASYFVCLSGWVGLAVSTWWHICMLLLHGYPCGVCLVCGLVGVGAYSFRTTLSCLRGYRRPRIESSMRMSSSFRRTSRAAVSLVRVVSKLMTWGRSQLNLERKRLQTFGCAEADDHVQIVALILLLVVLPSCAIYFF